MPPTGPYANRERDGLTSLIDWARTGCQLNATFGPVLKSKWANTPAIVALVTILDSLCPLVQPAADAQFDYVNEGDNTAIDDEGGQLYIGRLPNATPPEGV